MTHRNHKLVVVFALLFVLSNIGCQKNIVTAHPNQINSFDGQTYDALVSAQAALDEAKAQFKAGTLPSTAKPVINAAGSSYEQARTVWQLWRDIQLGVKQGDAAAVEMTLGSDMQQLAIAIINLQKITGGK